VVNRRSAPRPLNANTLADAKEQLKSLGGFGAGLGQLLDAVAKISDGAEQGQKDGSFSIGGPKSPLRGSYSMRVGSLSDVTPKRRAAPVPRAQAAAPASRFTPSLFETSDGAMIVAEVGALGEADVTMTVAQDGLSIIIATPDDEAELTLPRAAMSESRVAIVNGIMTITLSWRV
jgi:hypothetical protein